MYRPDFENWKERLRTEGDDSIYLYSIKAFKQEWERTRVEEIWIFPWLWPQKKGERMAWIMKYFNTDVEKVSVQEHIELDNFFAEFDIPCRWGYLRIKEFDVLNAFFVTLNFWFDFPGIKPTDLGLRPDGTLKPCPVQFRTCISSSNEPTDKVHYAAPFKWERGKSPEQVHTSLEDE